MNALVGVASAGSGGSGRARVERLGLGYVTFPGWHPRAAETGCPVFGFAVVHPDGVIVFDTGVGRGYSFIDDLYAPTVCQSWRRWRQLVSTNVMSWPS